MVFDVLQSSFGHCLSKIMLLYILFVSIVVKLFKNYLNDVTPKFKLKLANISRGWKKKKLRRKTYQWLEI